MKISAERIKSYVLLGILGLWVSRLVVGNFFVLGDL